MEGLLESLLDTLFLSLVFAAPDSEPELAEGAAELDRLRPIERQLQLAPKSPVAIVAARRVAEAAGSAVRLSIWI